MHKSTLLSLVVLVLALLAAPQLSAQSSGKKSKPTVATKPKKHLHV